MTANLNFEAGDGEPLKPKKFAVLEKKEIIALIRIVRERKPHFVFGNQYRDALNSICEASIDHAEGLNSEIMNLALGITKLPDQLEEAVVKWMPNANDSFDRALDPWKQKKGGSNE